MGGALREICFGVGIGWYYVSMQLDVYTCLGNLRMQKRGGYDNTGCLLCSNNHRCSASGVPQGHPVALAVQALGLLVLLSVGWRAVWIRLPPFHEKAWYVYVRFADTPQDGAQSSTQSCSSNVRRGGGVLQAQPASPNPT